MRTRLLLVSLAAFLPLIALGQRTDLSGLKFCIDPGHGGHNPANDRRVEPDPGIVFWESESNFQKALLLRSLLQAKGATVLLTRETNDYPDDSQEPTLAARVAFANANNVDWFHSIHSNASGLAVNTSINYTLMLVREKRSLTDPAANTGPGLGVPETQAAWDLSLIMAPRIQSHLRTTTNQTRLDWTFYGGANGGYSLGVLRGLLMPGQLSEGSFHDFFPETRRLMNNHYRKMEAYALLKSWMQYFNVPADTLGIVAGIQTDSETGKPKNGTVVRILPQNRVYNGDSFNNGFFMYDSLTPGAHTLVFETPYYLRDTVTVTVPAAGIAFVDRTLTYAFPYVVQTTPAVSDTSFPVTASVVIRFSTAMDTASIRGAISIAPPVEGTLQWSGDLKMLTFKPSSPLEYFRWYTVSFDSTARAATGYGLDVDADGIGGDPYSFSFRTETGLKAQALAIGQVRLNQTATSALIFHNRASYPIVLYNLAGIVAPFASLATLPITIPPIDSVALPVSFTPVSYGSFMTTAIASADSGTVTAFISGSSPVPNVVPSHTLLGYGTVSIDTSRDRPFFLRTTSINGARIDSLYTKTPAFRISPQLSFPFSLILGDTLFLTVTFAPQSVGLQYDTLWVVSNTTGSPHRVTLTGTGTAPSPVEQVADIVERFDLLQNFPNPFNPSTHIEFHLPESAPVRLEILDLLGRSVRVLLRGDYAAGKYRVPWDGTDNTGNRVGSGIYVYRLTAGHHVVATRKMILLR